MDDEQIMDVLQDHLRTNLEIRRGLGLTEGESVDRIDEEGDLALAFTDGDGDQHFITVESA